MDGSTTSIDDIIKGNKYSKVPTSSTPLSPTSRSGGSAVIPIAAGLSAAAAAGIGAKAYIDRKKNSDNGGDDDIYTEEWDGDEENDMEFSYEDTSEADKENYLEDEDDLSYQAIENDGYVARGNDELTDL